MILVSMSQRRVLIPSSERESGSNSPSTAAAGLVLQKSIVTVKRSRDGGVWRVKNLGRTVADRAWAAIAESGGRRTATNSSVACHGSIKVRISKELEFEAEQRRWISPATVVESSPSSPAAAAAAKRAFKAAALACVSGSMAESCSETTMASVPPAGEETSGVAGGSSSRRSRASTAITG